MNTERQALLIERQKRLNAIDAEQRRLGPHGGRLVIWKDPNGWGDKPLLRARLDTYAEGCAADWWCPVIRENAPFYSPIRLESLIPAMQQAIERDLAGSKTQT